MYRFITILVVLLLSGCLSKSRDEIIDFQGVSPSEGVKYLDRIEEKSGNNPDIYYKRASLYFELEQYDKALKDINRSLEIEESNADYVYLAGRIDQKLNRPTKAIEHLLLAEGLGLHSHVLYQSLAEEYLKLDKPEEAKKAIERLIDLNQNSSNYALAGQISLNLGDTVYAEKYYRESIKQGANVASFAALHDIYHHKGEFQTAGRYINSALEISPDNVANLRKKGSLLAELDDLDSAKGIYKNVLSMDSSKAVFYYDLGQTCYKLFEYDTARIMAEKALQADEQYIEARMLLARVFNRTSDYNQAITAYQDILTQDSTFNLAKVELENLQRKVAYLRRLDEHRKALDSARKNAPVIINRKGIDN